MHEYDTFSVIDSIHSSYTAPAICLIQNYVSFASEKVPISYCDIYQNFVCVCVCVWVGGWVVNFLSKLNGMVTCPQPVFLYIWYAGSSDTLIHCDLRTVNLLMHWQTNVVQQMYIYVLCKYWEQRCTSAHTFTTTCVF